MRKRFRELAFILVVLGLFIVLLNITYIADASFSSYVRKAGFFNTVILFAFAMIFLTVSTFCGYIFGVDRGKGRVIERGDLVEDKPFRITLIELVSSLDLSYVTIDVDDSCRILKVYRKVPKGATHLRVTKTNLGPAIEFLEITPEVVKTVPTS